MTHKARFLNCAQPSESKNNFDHIADNNNKVITFVDNNINEHGTTMLI